VRLRETFFIPLLVLALSACRTGAADGPVPAVLVDPDERARAELQHVVSLALGNTPVTLADDALTTGSLLLVEHGPHRDAEGRRIMGRDPSMPERFQLVLDGASCVLVQLRTGHRWPLREVTCAQQPAPPAGP
jgi:hypothetical protein